MPAAAFANGTISVAGAPEPRFPTARRATISIDSCGICGSDLSLVRDTGKFVRVAPLGRFELAEFGTTRPVVPGHEFSRTVRRDAGAFKVGDRVTGIGIATAPNDDRTITGYSPPEPRSRPGDSHIATTVAPRGRRLFRSG